VTQTHYDPTHNFYYLLQGRKRFTISPPNNHDALYLHPFTHPAHRQTQTFVLADLNQNQSALFPKYGKAEAVSVLLEEVPLCSHLVRNAGLWNVLFWLGSNVVPATVHPASSGIIIGECECECVEPFIGERP